MAKRSDRSVKIPLTDEWRGSMVEARKLRGMDQLQLGRRVGASQGQISRIESGSVESSEFVPAICRLLGLPMPAFPVDELQREWMEVGAQLKALSPEGFSKALELAEWLLSEVSERKK